jgi:hypothetical protein
MRLLKKSGVKARFFAGRHLASTRMHTHLPQMFHAWARIFAGTARGSVWPMIATIAFLVACVLSVYVAAGIWVAYATPATSFLWPAAIAAHWLLMTVLLGVVWRWSGKRARVRFAVAPERADRDRDPDLLHPTRHPGQRHMARYADRPSRYVATGELGQPIRSRNGRV